MAPRPVYVASASKDKWADPEGEYLSLLNSGSVYLLFGYDVIQSTSIPMMDEPRWKGQMGYHIREGKHDVTMMDWQHYLGFANLHLNGIQAKK